MNMQVEYHSDIDSVLVTYIQALVQAVKLGEQKLIPLGLLRTGWYLGLEFGMFDAYAGSFRL